MGLLQKCCETYDYHAHLVGVFKERKTPLIPIAHVLKNADVEVTVDRYGRFINAELVIEGDESTIIPVTIDSAGRTVNSVAHPLCDKLKYMLRSNVKEFAEYIEELQRWSESVYGSPKLSAILNYLKSGTIEDDLYSCKVLSGVSSKGKKKEHELFIRWRVEGFGTNAECWLDQELFASWTNYYLSTLNGDKGFCMVTGEETFITENHPKNIITSKDGINAKFISANDKTNFTFRGRFVNIAEANTVGYVASQKAHSMLSWQASRGYFIGGRIFMCWNPKGFVTPNPFESLGVYSEKNNETDYKNDLRKTLNGYKLDLPDNEDVIIASIEAVSKGRVSLTYYSELKASDFLERIGNWYRTCYWINGKLGVQSPPIYQIIRCAYGVERADSEKLVVDDNISKDNQQRLFKCILDNMSIPYDMVRCLLLKASKPESYNRQKKDNYRELLFVACAVIRKFLNDRSKKEEWTLSLDKDKGERSYLFGRLLAVFERIEEHACGFSEDRETNAIRMQSAYCEKPFYHANIIHNRLMPYFEKLSHGSRNYYRKLIGEIMEKIAECESKDLNKPLGETYLLGYYLQRNDLYKSKKDHEMEE